MWYKIEGSKNLVIMGKEWSSIANNSIWGFFICTVSLQVFRYQNKPLHCANKHTHIIYASVNEWLFVWCKLHIVLNICCKKYTEALERGCCISILKQVEEKNCCWKLMYFLSSVICFHQPCLIKFPQNFDIHSSKGGWLILMIIIYTQLHTLVSIPELTL